MYTYKSFAYVYIAPLDGLICAVCFGINSVLYWATGPTDAFSNRLVIRFCLLACVSYTHDIAFGLSSLNVDFCLKNFDKTKKCVPPVRSFELLVSCL